MCGRGAHLFGLPPGAGKTAKSRMQMPHGPAESLNFVHEWPGTLPNKTARSHVTPTTPIVHLMSKKTLLTVLTSGLIVWGAACPAVAATPESLPAQTPPAKFKKASTVTSGRRYLFVVNLGGQYNVATAAADNSTYSYLYVGEPAAVDADGTLHIADPSYAFTLTATTDGYTIQDCHGRYLIQQLEEYDYFGLSDKPEAGSTWTVKAENDGTFTLTNTQLGKTIGYDRYYSSFGAYAQKNNPRPILYEEAPTE